MNYKDYEISPKVQTILNNNLNPRIKVWTNWKGSCLETYEGVIIDDSGNLYLLEGESELDEETGYKSKPRLQLYQKSFTRSGIAEKRTIMIAKDNPVLEEIKRANPNDWISELTNYFKRLVELAKPFDVYAINKGSANKR